MEKQLVLSITKKDFRVETFRSGKHCGGQNSNSRDTAVRITHIASGVVAECQEERNQLQNKKRAFMRLAESPAFKNWHKIEVARLMGQEIESRSLPSERVRTYNLPDKRITDHKRGTVYCNVHAVLDGDLDMVR
jgi:peptide chain release factor 1